MLFMVQEEYLLECMYRSWQTLCLSKWAKEGAQFVEYNINCPAEANKYINLAYLEWIITNYSQVPFRKLQLLRSDGNLNFKWLLLEHKTVKRFV